MKVGPLKVDGTKKLIYFQINRDLAKSTVEEEPSQTVSPASPSLRQSAIAFVETILIFLCFIAVAGQGPPAVNESHYLTKAKHFWNPDWCPGDLFLASSFSHWLFYFGLGWPTKYLSLSTFAWLGRLMTWAAMAWAWRRLSWRLIPVPLMGCFSAILFLILNERFHLAGEWVVGGFEAKGIAYCFVVFALGDMLIGRWRRVWPWLGAAAAFHVLVGGWAMLAAGLSWCLSQRSNRQHRGTTASLANWHTLGQQLSVQSPYLLLALTLLAIGAIPPFLADQQATPAEIAAASLIYVNQRIAHHLTFAAFPTMHVARFVLLILTWALLFNWSLKRCLDSQNRLAGLYYFGIGSLVISLGGLILSGLADSDNAAQMFAARLLRFYWFRLADFAIPATTALAIGSVTGTWLLYENNRARKICAATASGLILVAASLLVRERNSDPRPFADQRSLPSYPGEDFRTQQTYSNWRKVCRWIESNTPTDAVFITPHEQQTFKWYAGRTEVVNWKDVPQDARSITEWDRRVQELLEPQRQFELGLMNYSDEQLQALSQKYQADFLVVPQWQVELVSAPTKLRQVYPAPGDKSTFVVFKF